MSPAALDKRADEEAARSGADRSPEGLADGAPLRWTPAFARRFLRDFFLASTESRIRRHPLVSEGLEIALLFGGVAVILGASAALFWLLAALAVPAEDPTDSSELVGAIFILVTVTALIVAHVGIHLALRRVLERRPLNAASALRIKPIAVVAVAVVVLWWERPLFHGVAMLLYVYPLVTWIPLLLGLAVVAGSVVGAVTARRTARAGLRFGLAWHTCVVVASWIVFMALLPSWQAQALYAASSYIDTPSLPLTTQPRLLPKAAARDRGELRDAHLVVDPSSGQLEWSAEHKAGFMLRGSSDGVVLQPLDRVNATLTSTRR